MELRLKQIVREVTKDESCNECYGNVPYRSHNSLKRKEKKIPDIPFKKGRDGEVVHAFFFLFNVLSVSSFWATWAKMMIGVCDASRYMPHSS